MKMVIKMWIYIQRHKMIVNADTKYGVECFGFCRKVQSESLLVFTNNDFISLFYISVLKAKISLWFNCVQMILAIIK
jgi:hypothetical protein